MCGEFSFLFHCLLLNCFLLGREIQSASIKFNVDKGQIIPISFMKWERIQPEMEKLRREMLNHRLTQININLYPKRSQKRNILPEHLLSQFIESDKQLNFMTEKTEENPIQIDDANSNVQEELESDDQLFQILNAISGGQHEELKSSLLSVIRKVTEDLKLKISIDDLLENKYDSILPKQVSSTSPLPVQVTSTPNSNSNELTQRPVLQIPSQSNVLNNLHSTLTGLPVIGQIFVMRDSPMQEVQPHDTDTAHGGFSLNMVKMTFNFNFQYLPPPPTFPTTFVSH